MRRCSGVAEPAVSGEVEHAVEVDLRCELLRVAASQTLCRQNAWSLFQCCRGRRPWLCRCLWFSSFVVIVVVVVVVVVVAYLTAALRCTVLVVVVLFVVVVVIVVVAVVA